MPQLSILYDGRTPTITWSPRIPYPSSYNLYWSPGPDGPWERINGTAILLTQFRDPKHTLKSVPRSYWKVTAQIGGIEVVHVPSTQWVPSARSVRVTRILNEIKRRHERIMLDKFGGEPCTIFLRRAAGDYCRNGATEGDGYQHRYEGPLCPYCFNTGIEGGYVKMLDQLIRVRNAQNEVELRQEGFALTEGRVAWLGAYPLMYTGDFFIRQTGERFAVSNVRRRELQGHVTLQLCNIKEIEPQHPLYNINPNQIS